jgi:hypothetical protein
MNNLRRIPLSVIIAVLIVSCGPPEFKEIPLNEIDPELLNKGALMASDILNLIIRKEGPEFLLDKDYITPLVHGRIMTNLESYKKSWYLISLTIGKESRYELFQVLDKRIIKTMRYKVYTDNPNIDFVELKIDINSDYKLADYYLYVTTKDGKFNRQNILPAFRK